MSRNKEFCHAWSYTTQFLSTYAAIFAKFLRALQYHFLMRRTIPKYTQQWYEV